MLSLDQLEIETQRSYQRVTQRLRQDHEAEISSQPEVWSLFFQRLEQHFPRLFGLYYHLYADRYDFFYHLQELTDTLARMAIARPTLLRSLDVEREADPLWFHSNQMVGGVCYVDLFAGNLAGIRSKIPYFKELGLTYLHLMPLFRAPQGDNDGGYAVSSYREVNPTLGSMPELAELASDLRREGISLVVDLVFNHTSDEHDWALKALAGDPEYQAYYRMFPDRTMPDAYEATLREIFPDEHPGTFTYRPEINRWVWTTFHAYQWDLNYANPVVFNRMAEEMLFLANTGVEVLRLDAVAFIWKELGTSCENLPEAHLLIQAFNAVAQIAAPALIFKSEAIVHPDEVVRYIHPDECQVSYNPLLMALLWNTLATRDVNLLSQALAERFQIKPQCAWVNYVRCHDDIGWTFSDDDAARLGVNGFNHRQFLNNFYTGRFPGSFARGLPFQENPATGDARISGTCASLAGLEKALLEETEHEVQLAIQRILLIHAVILMIGGIPLFYLGDEVCTLNDYAYRNDPAKMHDSRWVHRPISDWEKISRRHDPESIEGRIFSGLQQFIQLRKSHAAFSGGEMQVIRTDSPHVLGFVRSHAAERILVFANFNEEPHSLPANLLRLYGLGSQYEDLFTHQPFPTQDIRLEPFQFMCLKS